jgi:fibronectin type 3 domain-containing protein
MNARKLCVSSETLGRMLRCFLLLLVFSAGLSSAFANTVSQPVSVVIPSGMEGQLLSRPVSVAVPVGLDGQILSWPVTVSVQEGKLVEPDLLGSWQMEGDWRDTSGYGNHAAGINSPVFSAVRAEGSWSAAFNGSNSYLDAGAFSAFDTAPARTLEAWIKPTVAQRAPIVDKYNIGLEYQAAGTLRLWIRSTDGSFPEAVTVEGYPANGEWLHVAGVYMANQSLEIYINGQLKATTALTTEIDQAYTPSNLFIAKSNQSAAYYAGLIDHVSVYKRVLSAAEVSDRYNYLLNSSFPPAEPGVIGAPQVTADNPLTLSGTREAGTAIWINGVEKVPADEVAVTWQADVALNYGPNLLSIAAKNQNGIFSKARLLSPIFDNQPPTVTGITPGAGVLINNNQPNLVVDFADTYSAIDYSVTTGETASVTDSGGEVVAGTWAATGAKQAVFTPTGSLSDGIYTVSLTPTDLLGNATVFTSKFEVDATPPAPPVVLNPPAVVGHAASLQGTMPLDAVSLLVTSTGGVVRQVSYPQAGQWSVNLDNLPAGVVTINLIAVDAAGNRSETLVLLLSVDLTPPGAPSIDPVTSPTALASVELTGQKDADSFLYLNGQAINADFAATTWSVALNLAEGENLLVFETVDAVDNVSASVSVLMIRDNQGPTLVSATPVVNAVASEVSQVVITLADTYSAIDYPASLATAGLRNSLGNVVTTGIWSTDNLSIQYDLPQGETLPGDVYTLNLAPVDTLGNASLVVYTFTVDQTAPAVSSLIMNPASPHRAETVSFRLNFDEPMDTSVSPEVTLVGEGGQSYQVYDSTALFSESFSTPEGTVPNDSLWSFEGSGNDGPIIKGGRLELSTLAPAEITSKFLLVGDFVVEVDFDVTGALGVNSWNSVLGVSFPSSTAIDHIVMERRYSSAPSYGFQTRIDNSWANFVSQGTADQTGKTRLTRTGTVVYGDFWDGTDWVRVGSFDYGSAPDANLKLWSSAWDQNPATTVWFDNLRVLSGTISGLPDGYSGGTWISPTSWQSSHQFTDQSGDGFYLVSATGAQDMASNTMAPQDIGSFELDTVAPVVPTVSSTVPPASNLSSLLLQGNGEAGAEIVINGVVRSTVDVSGSWTYNYPLTEGLNSLAIVARDAAGNNSAATDPVPSVTCDTTPPVFTIAPYPTISASASLSLGGAIEAGASLELDGVGIIDQDGDPNNGTWAYTLALAGTGLQERYVFAALDGQQNRIEKTVTVTYDAAAPAALPVGALSADGAGNGSQVMLSWPTYSEPLDLAYYRIYVAQTSITDITGLSAVGTVNRGTRSFTVGGLTAGTSYTFAVEPIDGIGNSEKTVNSVSVSPSDIAPPEEIRNLSATASYAGLNANTVNLSWQASADTAQDLADQILSVDAGSGYEAGLSLGATVTAHQVTGLSDNQVYKFKITTKDTTSHESNGVYIQVATALNNPVNLSAQPGKNKVSLSWAPVSSAHLSIYKLYRQAAAFSDVNGMTAFKAQTGTSFVDTLLENGTTYHYAVTAVTSSAAEKTLVESVSATPRQDETGPVIGAPLILDAAGNIVLSENHVLSQPLTLSVSASDFANESAVTSVVVLIDGVEVASGTSSASYFWNLVAETDGSHILKIVATDAVGNISELSRTVLVSLAPPSSDPQQLKISAPADGSTQNVETVTVNGQAPRFTTVTLKLNGAVTSTAAVDNGGYFSFPGVPLAPGTNSLSVMASHRGGDSNYSAPVQVVYDTGAPEAPQNLAAQVLPGGKLQLTWNAGIGEVPTGFNLYSSAASFTTADAAGVSKLNIEGPIVYQFSEQLPADDNARFYAVTALDDSANESPLSNVIEVTADRILPTISSIDFIIGNIGSGSQADLIAGPGQVAVSLTVSEPLSETPFFSLEPGSGSPIVVPLKQVAGTLDYSGSFQVSATTPHGATSYNFSAKDLVGNRGTASGAGPILDSRGPQASIGNIGNLLEAAGSASLNLAFDEAPSAETASGLALQLVDSQGGVADVTLSYIDPLTWSGDLLLDGLTAGNASFRLVSAVKDAFGNSSTSIVAGGSLELYVGSPPAPSVPLGLTAAGRKDGEISLAWKGVAGATAYRVYRQPAAGSQWELIAEVSSIFHDDTPLADGDYRYAVSAVGLLESESELSASVTASSDRIPPEVPAGLQLNGDGNGIQASWDAVIDAASYKLYQHDGTQRGALVTSTAQLLAGDPAPLTNPQGYVVTALDALGNESPASAVMEATFTVAPPASLVVTQSEGGKPELTWSGSGAGYFIYRNGSKINPAALNVTSYTDVYYTGGSVSYGVSMVDGAGLESPIRELNLPDLNLALPEGTSLRRGVLENIPLVLSSNQAVEVASLRLKVGSQPESTLVGPFALTAGSDFTLSKVAVAGLDAQSTVAVLCTAVLKPAAGSRIEISRTSVAQVSGSGTALELFNEPLTRGTPAEVRFKLNNLGSARLDLLTSENGGATAKVRVFLKDEDGNVLAQGSLNQRTGSQVVNSGSYATARIEPGESFLSAPISFLVPASAPYRVVLEIQIDNSYYHYQQNEQVVAPGFNQKLMTTISDVSYRPNAQVDRLADASGNKSYTQGETVLIRGTARSTLDETPMAYVPVRIGVAISGFDRYFDVTTDADGRFSYTYVPGANEAGHYNVWANHPDLTDRSVQDSFDIVAMSLSLNRFNLNLTRDGAYDIPLELKNLSGAELTGLTLSTTASTGLTAEIINSGDAVLHGNEVRRFSLRIRASAEAPAQGSASLEVVAGNGLSQRLAVNVACFSNIPIIATSPSFIEAGLVRNTQQVKNFTIRNSGMANLIKINLDAPSLPWIKLAMNPFLGDLAVGTSTNVGLLIQPGEAVVPGTYTDRVVIRSDNHIPYTYNIKVTVTSDAVGSVLFDVLNELNEDVAGATIVVQHQQQPELIYTLKTLAAGTITKTDIPEGRYTYNISAPGHKSYGGSFTIYPGLQVTVPIALEVNLVQVEWSVTEVTLEDRYEIRIEQTFETNVPTAVIVVEPPIANLPLLELGQVYNGEFTITNYGLISAKFKGLTFPETFDEFSVEVFNNVPESLGAMERVVIPYRITRKAAQ